MFANRRGVFKGLLLLACGALVVALLGLAACGGEETSTSGTEATEGSTGDGGSTPAPDSADVADADPDDLEVIRGWSETLSEGDVEGAAGFFAIPSTAENGPILVKIESRADAIDFNRSLPCGATVLSAQTTGNLTTATFELSERPGGGCGQGVGGTASTSFAVEDGKIVEWRRIVEPGQGGGGGSSSASPS